MDMSKFDVLVHLRQFTQVRGDFFPKSITLSTEIGCTCGNVHIENLTVEHVANNEE